MDAFFAAVEQRDDPDLAGKPVIVGGIGSRGVVSTASYEARKFGVRSAMSMITARRLCPEGIFLAGSYAKYVQTSAEIREILDRYSPLVEPLSLDEAFLDISGTEMLYPNVVDLAKALKEEIKKELHLIASVGIAPNKFLAKMASDHQKPDGLVLIRHGEELNFLHPIAVRKLWGVGEMTAKSLNRIGIKTIGQLREAEVKVLENILGSSAHDLINLAQGIDERQVVPHREPKSIGNETTFETDLYLAADIHAYLLSLSSEVGARLRRKGYNCRTVTLKVRFASFKTLTRSVTLATPTNLDEVIYQTVLASLSKLTLNEGIRLLGVTGSNLLKGTQISIFNEENEKRAKIAQAMDKLNAKYGQGTITKASILGIKAGQKQQKE
jgi:DNA polymerase-4